MRLSTPDLAADALVNAINAGTDWITANTTHALIAHNTGAQIRLTAGRYGTVHVNGASVTLVWGMPSPESPRARGFSSRVRSTP
jgi:hypothetical protein